MADLAGELVDDQVVTVGSTRVVLPALTPAATYFRVLRSGAFTVAADDAGLPVPVINFAAVEAWLPQFIGPEVFAAVMADPEVTWPDIDRLVLTVARRYLVRSDADPFGGTQPS
jgi:hypothetical protein